MKVLVFILSLFSVLISNAQLATVELELDLDKDCGFDSIGVQSIYASTFTKLDAGIKKHDLKLFTPVDRVVFMAEGASNQAVAYNIAVEEKVYLSANKEQGCNNLIIVSKADKRMEAFARYEKLPAAEKPEKLLSLIQKNLNAVTVGDYLKSYLNSDFVSKELSRRILSLLEAQPGPALEHYINQVYVNNIKMSVAESPLEFFVADTLLISHQSASFNADKEQYDYRLIDFWYTSCAPCLKQHKIFKEKIEQGVFPEQVELVGIAIEPFAHRWQAFLEKNSLPWKNFLEKAEANLQQKYGIIVYPSYLLVNKEGYIIDRLHSYRAFEIKMKELLKD